MVAGRAGETGGLGDFYVVAARVAGQDGVAAAHCES